MSERDQIVQLEHDLHQFKMALTNARAIKDTYLSFGPKFDELHQKIDMLAKKQLQIEAQLANHQNMIVKALQDKFRGGTS